jgi:hypothetical protein
MDYVFICKHCEEPFVVSHVDFNCRILRHGVYKRDMKHIPPHASKEDCDALVRDGLIYGCGRPLKIVETATTTTTTTSTTTSTDAKSPTYDVVICDYI